MAVGAISEVDDARTPRTGRRAAWVSLLLLMAINLFNYVDRQVLSAVEPQIRREILHESKEPVAGSTQPIHAKTRTGFLASAFLFSYMLSAPVFGWLADRMSRWILIGISVVLWTLASGASGLAPTFAALLITRLFVGVGEGGYGPAAPTIIADLYPLRRRGSAMSWFYMAIPVGTALGYVLGGAVLRYAPGHNWRWAFYAVVPPGLLLGIGCFFMKEPPRGHGDAADRPGQQRRATLRDYLTVFRVRSYLLDTAGMAAMTFAIGGISFFMPGYLEERHAASDPNQATVYYGLILLLAGITATLAGGFIGDALQKTVPGSYFIVSATGIFLSVIFILLMLDAPFPRAWLWMFFAVFFLFFNTGPSSTILANVIHPSMRATAFALNIFVIHLLGDVPSPPLFGTIVDRYSWRAAFYVVCAIMVAGGLLWLWGARYLAEDTKRAPGKLE